MGERSRRTRQAERHPAGAAPAPAADTQPTEPTSADGAGVRERGPRPASRATGSTMLRLWWMIVGNGLLGLAMAGIVMAGGWRLSLADVTFWVSVATLLVTRFLDISRFGGTTADGEPATMSHWRGYALKLLGTTLATWVAAHLLARVVGP